MVGGQDAKPEDSGPIVTAKSGSRSRIGFGTPKPHVSQLLLDTSIAGDTHSEAIVTFQHRGERSCSRPSTIIALACRADQAPYAPRNILVLKWDICKHACVYLDSCSIMMWPDAASCLFPR